MRARFSFPSVLILLLSYAPLAAAQDFAVQVSPQGLDTLADVALTRLPTVYPIEASDPVLGECIGDGQIIAHVPEIDVNLNFQELNLSTEDGRILVSTVMDISFAETIQIENVNLCLGTATCDVDTTIENLGIAIELAAGTSPSGGVEFHGAMVNLDLVAEDLLIASEGCLVGDALEWFIQAVETWGLTLLTPRLEAALEERLATAMTDLFSETVGLHVERDGFTIDASVESLDLSRLRGFGLGAGAVIAWSESAIYDEPSPEVLAPTNDALPASFVGDFQLATTDRLVTTALYEAWRGGLLRRLLADQSQSIELGGEGAAQALGLEPGTAIDIAFDIEKPLQVAFGREAENVAGLTMEELHVIVDVRPPSGLDSSLELFLSASMAMEMEMSEEAGGMVMDLHDMQVLGFRIVTEDDTLKVGGAQLSTFVENTLSPMIAERLSGVPVAPGLHAVEGAFVHIRAVESQGGWLRLGADLLTPDPNDTTAPDTSLTDPATLLPAGTAAFAISGSDDATPTTLLRYRAWLDGTLLNEGVPSSLRAIRFDVTGGQHTLEVAAVDLSDNEDGSPVSHTFDVDGNPPILTVTEAPPAVFNGAIIEATWTASDPEGGPVESAWVLREIDQDSVAVTVQEQPFGADMGALAIATSTLSGTSLYELEIQVRDEAGNLSSETFGIAVPNAGSGCAISASPQDSRPWLVGLVGLVGVLLYRRRR